MLKAMVAVLAIASGFSQSPALVRKPAWQQHIDWSTNDKGDPNCPEKYYLNPILRSCLTSGVLSGKSGYGGRYCVMDLAIEAAYRQLDAQALTLTAELGQCHSHEARKELYEAGPARVGEYLRRFDRPSWTRSVDVVAAAK